MASFEDLKLHRGVKEREGKVLYQIAVQWSVLEGCGLKTDFSGKACRTVVVTRGWTSSGNSMIRITVAWSLTLNHFCRISGLQEKASL